MDCVRGFVALWHGEQPLVADFDADAAAVEAMQRGGCLVMDPDGRLVGIHGLSARSSRHRIVHDGRSRYTWCALDAVGIPAALGLDAEAVTSCPTCGRELRVEVAAGRPTGDPGLRLWLPTGPCEHVLEDLCAHANLYCDDEHLAADRTRPAGTALTLPEAAAVGRQTWADVAATGVGRRRP